MNRFSRDFALIRSNTGQVIVESHDRARLERLQQEFADEDIACEIIASDLPRSRVKG